MVRKIHFLVQIKLHLILTSKVSNYFSFLFLKKQKQKLNFQNKAISNSLVPRYETLTIMQCFIGLFSISFHDF